MFKILDGRSQFYQWDIDRKIVVDDITINQVHFCNRTDECSLVCEVYDLDGLRVADVPNILLQQDWRINVYAYDRNYTKHCEVYEVVKRSKPADYVYTETEVLNFDVLLEKMDNIEGSIESTVTDYLKENPPTTDLTGYATEEYVQEQIGGIEIPEVDFTGIATEKYVDEALAALPEPVIEEKEVYVGTAAPTDPDVKIWVNPAAENPFATKKYVDDAVAGIEIPEPGETDLSNYYNKTETDAAITEAIGKIEHPTPDLSKYVLESALKNKVKTIMTDENVVDTYYLELNGYATKADIANAIAAIANAEEGAY